MFLSWIHLLRLSHVVTFHIIESVHLVAPLYTVSPVYTLYHIGLEQFSSFQNRHFEEFQCNTSGGPRYAE